MLFHLSQSFGRETPGYRRFELVLTHRSGLGVATPKEDLSWTVFREWFQRSIATNHPIPSGTFLNSSLQVDLVTEQIQVPSLPWIVGTVTFANVFIDQLDNRTPCAARTADITKLSSQVGMEFAPIFALG